MSVKKDLPEFDGKTAFGGALRFFEPEDSSWKSIWGHYYGSLMPNIKVFAEDAFGTIFGIANNNEIAIFWGETGEIELIGVGLDDFYEMILQDPNGTINYDLYQQALEEIGKPSTEEHFAFKIEVALGGKLSIDNIVIMNSVEHFKAMAKIAHQIKDIPVGEQIRDVSLGE